MDEDKDEDLLEAKGYDWTHWDCPNCGYDGQTEGDAKGDVLECPDCQTRFRIVA